MAAITEFKVCVLLVAATKKVSESVFAYSKN